MRSELGALLIAARVRRLVHWLLRPHSPRGVVQQNVDRNARRDRRLNRPDGPNGIWTTLWNVAICNRPWRRRA